MAPRQWHCGLSGRLRGRDAALYWQGRVPPRRQFPPASRALRPAVTVPACNLKCRRLSTDSESAALLSAAEPPPALWRHGPTVIGPGFVNESESLTGARRLACHLVTGRIGRLRLVGPTVLTPESVRGVVVAQAASKRLLAAEIVTVTVTASAKWGVHIFAHDACKFHAYISCIFLHILYI